MVAERRGDRGRGVALAEEVDDHRQRLEVEQRGEGELAEHERHRDEGGREHPGPTLGSTIRAITVNHPAPRERPASASVATSIEDRAASMAR